MSDTPSVVVANDDTPSVVVTSNDGDNEIDPSLPALETKQEADTKQAKETISEEEKRRAYERKMEHYHRMMLVTNPNYNSACGVLPTLLSVNRKWNLLFPTVPAYHQHLKCPYNPKFADMQFLLLDEEENVHATPGKFCCCETELAPHLNDTQQKAYESIVAMATAPVSSELCMPIIGLTASRLIHPVVQAIVQRAIHIECSNQPTPQRPRSSIPTLIKDIEVFVLDESKVEPMYELLKEQLVRNERIINEVQLPLIHNKHKLFFKHEQGYPEIQITILPHKALRKGWHTFPADNVYILDALVHNENTACVRKFIALTAYGARTRTSPIRRMVILGTDNNQSALIVGTSNLHAFRKYAEDMQVEQRQEYNKQQQMSQQRMTEQFTKLSMAKAAAAADAEMKAESKEVKDKEPVNEDAGVEMTDVQYEARQQLRVIKEEKESMDKLSFYQGLDANVLAAGVSLS